MQYPIVIHKDSDSDYGVTIPDLPGCFSAGVSIEEAIGMAQEAAECHIEGLLLDSEPVPAASPIESHQKNPDYRNGFWALIKVDLGKLPHKPERVSISIPEGLLNAIDHYTQKHGETISGFLVQAVTEYMRTHGTKMK